MIHWISVEENLPEPGEQVLVWLGRSGYKLWDIAWYSDRYKEWIDSRDEVCYPTHYSNVTPP